MFAPAICSPSTRRSRTKARHKILSPTHPPHPNKPLDLGLPMFFEASLYLPTMWEVTWEDKKPFGLRKNVGKN